MKYHRLLGQMTNGKFLYIFSSLNSDEVYTIKFGDSMKYLFLILFFFVSCSQDSSFNLPGLVKSNKNTDQIDGEYQNNDDSFDYDDDSILEKVEEPEEPECKDGSKGRILLAHDEWLFSNTGFNNGSDTSPFILNAVSWLRKCDRRQGNKFHAYSGNFSLNESKLQEVLSSAGYTYSVGTDFELSLDKIKDYDWIYLAGQPGDASSEEFKSVMDAYINQGGNVLIAAGTTGFVNTHFGEALFFNPFLATYGLRLTGDNNKLKGTHNLNNDHFLFEGVSKLYFQYGNPIHILDSKRVRPKAYSQIRGIFDLQYLMVI